MPNDGTAAIEQILTASDPWQALGLAPACVDEAAVKTACRRLSLKVHPDKWGSAEDTERLDLAKEAWCSVWLLKMLQCTLSCVCC